jgi:ATP-dependent Clp protease ATP-binding subunit ClpA
MFGHAKCSHDPIPDKAIRLSDAFERVREALRSNPEVLETLDTGLREVLIKNKEAEEKREKWKLKPHRTLIALQHLKEAVVFFRAALSRGELTAYIRDPEDGELLQLDSIDWSPVGGRLLFLEPPYAFEDDFLDDAAFSGNPKTFIRGAYRPVFLIRKDFERWLKKTFGRKLSGGRPPGVGSYEARDMPFLKKMEELLKTGEAKSVHNAAVKVVKDVPPGSAEEESIIRRLGRRYKKLFPSERN